MSNELTLSIDLGTSNSKVALRAPARGSERNGDIVPLDGGLALQVPSFVVYERSADRLLFGQEAEEHSERVRSTSKDTFFRNLKLLVMRH